MKKMRKKGAAIILLSLGLLISCFILAIVFIDVAIQFQTINRIMSATEETARVRAQAVDIALKEQEGIVEVFHEDYGVGITDNVDHNNITTKDGHYPIYKPSDTKYKEKVRLANKYARKAGLEILKSGLGTNIKSNNLIDADPTDATEYGDGKYFCIDVKPIPDTAGDTIHFSCTAYLNGTPHTFNYDYKVSNTEIFKYDKLKVKNAVFVGAVMDYHLYIMDGLKQFGFQEKTPYFTHQEVAFPQVDVCTREVDSNCTSSTKK